LCICDDGRSDNKGVEPEGLALLHVKGRVPAFIGLERTLKAAIAVFDITDRTTLLRVVNGKKQASRADGRAEWKTGQRPEPPTRCSVSK